MFGDNQEESKVAKAALNKAERKKLKKAKADKEKNDESQGVDKMEEKLYKFDPNKNRSQGKTDKEKSDLEEYNALRR